MKALRKTVKTLLIIVTSVLLIIGCALLLDSYTLYKQTKDQTGIQEKIADIRAQNTYTSLKEISPSYLDAVIAIEDHAFYDHGPIDLSAIGRAILVNIKEMAPKEGGSTITQQVAKNIFFTQEKSFRRKLAEAFMAFDLEQAYSKDDILELYINTNYFGDGCYGIQAASQGYYNKSPFRLTLAEAAMLAGIPNAPSVYSPTSNNRLAKQRQKQVLNQMVTYGFITREEADSTL